MEGFINFNHQQKKNKHSIGNYFLQLKIRWNNTKLYSMECTLKIALANNLEELHNMHSSTDNLKILRNYCNSHMIIT